MKILHFSTWTSKQEILKEKHTIQAKKPISDYFT